MRIGIRRVFFFGFLALLASGILALVMGCSPKKEESAPGYYEGPMQPKSPGGGGGVAAPKAGGV
jgi:hypothetical protein